MEGGQGGHLVVHGEDGVFGAVGAVSSLVLAFDDGEGVHDVVDVGAVDLIEVEVERVEFAAHEEAALVVPDEGRTVIADILREGLQIPCGVGEFQHTRGNKIEQGLNIGMRRDYRELFDNEEIEIRTSQFLPNNEIKYETTHIGY